MPYLRPNLKMNRHDISILPTDLSYVKDDGPRSSLCRFVSLQELESDEGIVTLHTAALFQVVYYR